MPTFTYTLLKHLGLFSNTTYTLLIKTLFLLTLCHFTYKMHQPTTEITRLSQFLTSMRLKTAGIWSRSQLATRSTAAGPEFNPTEIKKGPSRASSGGIFKGIYGVGNMGVCTLNTYKIMHKNVRRNE